MVERFLVLSALFGASLCSQPSALPPIAAPLRNLPWGQLNFLHTTDIHGWLGGHLQEHAYGADWGDYVSFAKHLHDKADAEGSDLLLVDTGDRIEGNGLYDASDPKGEYTFDIVKEQNIDLICSGNHELYKKNSSEGEYKQTVPNFSGNYLASNLDIYSPETGELVPLAPRYKKFKTKNQGIRILAFGFIFDFKDNANNTVVRTVEDTVKAEWFQDAIRDRDIDLVVVFGHVAIRSKEFSLIYKTIRSVQWDTPIQFFGGHTHIRDYKVYDGKSVALESGRYMETIGFMSISGLSSGGSKIRYPVSQTAGLSFSRRYIDNNLFSLHHHSGKDSDSFPTEHGRNVSRRIHAARKSLKLDMRHGCAPHGLWVNRVPYRHNLSIFTWLENHVLPDQLRQSSATENSEKAIVIMNTGAVRFDIFQGPFTKDTTYLVSPFTSGLRFVRNVPFEAAKQVMKLLNHEGPILDSIMGQNLVLAPPEQVAGRTDFDAPAEKHWLSASVLGPQIHLGDGQSLTPGYTTKDDAGDDGDDTLHAPISFYNVPNCIQAAVGFNMSHGNLSEVIMLDAEEPESVSLVYIDFIESWVLLALQYLGQKYNDSDTAPYMEGSTLTTIITDWVKENWNVRGESCP
ncbi:hypothetical protein K432DRAFT_316521 [Lepidopterella palustris CBS 459.81]|uniref:Calcineurin-like phosphoesterase domain-containing protein n=1 Tax=Lepidopterella palustris CBS 459.81 TaxID=1314670 RepID=A0A8E2JKR3_9PEZI|nr:hypothetical protein K432DRAFT_316521 [Lepidopterella palustris CBS 459.81]